MFNIFLGLVNVGLACYYAWHGAYDHATFNLLIGIWLIEGAKKGESNV